MKRLYGWIFVLPAFILLSVFTFYPIIATLIDSFYSDKTIFRPRVFLGFENYHHLLHDPVFITTLLNNFLFALGTVPASIILALIMALLVSQRTPAKGLIRLTYFTPTILPMIAVANIWLFFYTPQIGLFNKIIGLLGYTGINWLGNPSTALPSLMILTIWKEAGFFMIFYLAALQSLPKELYEAAGIEGTSNWSCFWKITFPLLMPTTFFITINALIEAFRFVDPIFVLTKGGPDNATNLLLYYIYETAFSFLNHSYAATLTVVLVLILVVLSIIQFGVIEKRIHYQ
ncbi:MAG: sugar ABC transporter permease [Epsilonproteobacteria bacterium]|nr:sugar ABC transporter permease [Campylobacterota bacterium]